MRVKLKLDKISFPQKEIPLWANKVDRWYQLDGPAFSFCESLYSLKTQFDQIVLASPGASTETDHNFCQSETPSPQKFVHTLPNVRASMALKSLGIKAQLMGLQNYPHTLDQGFEEFFFLCQEGKRPLLASSLIFDNDISLQTPKTYGVLSLSQDKKGDWELTQAADEPISDSSFFKELVSEKKLLQCGRWKLEQIGEPKF